MTLFEAHSRIGGQFRLASELLLGRDGRLEPVPVRGPVLVSQGTVPRPVDLGPGDWRAVVLDETPSAAEAIRLAAAIRL